ncbi:hypothetical protein BXP70_26095 [Hymenobacter crusticola]|uniref:PKD domain-containing protein n=1 Tax=Hymenobacter crusticola TaxID=1770526 RepID=A0A243W678_9BACT|nr:gliding motility-associated C-terminal domain-containing protein [Hymenobacter crusticola]OUJ69785.1 hypothetical protein BXP70_26095 [Hymenobacter crusticola]
MTPLATGRLYIEATGFTYALYDPLTKPAHANIPATPGSQLRCHAYSLTFAGSHPTVPVAEEALATTYNYFLGADPTRWTHDVPSYRRVRYPDLYPGIAATLYENETGNLEYDFHLQPGAQPNAIQLRYQGASELRLSNRQLLIKTSVGTVTELAPRAWQTDAQGQRYTVTCDYELVDNVVSFRLGAYDRSRPLIIDPTVVFASFSGATSDNWGVTATHDVQGNLYSASLAFGTGYPTSLGAYSQTYAEGVDVAIIKYNTQAAGPAARLYATYLGGRAADAPHRLVVDGNNELVVLGSTSSNDFPTTAGSYDRSFGGGTLIEPDAIAFTTGADLFVARLSTSGNALRAATYLGGTGNDGLAWARPSLSLPPSDAPTALGGAPTFKGDLAVDGANNVVLASVTNSRDFPVTMGTHRSSFQGGYSDAVVCKLSADLRSLQWSTYLGGNKADAAYALQLDATGTVYVCGGTASSNFPVSAGAYQPASTGGGADGFVAHLSADGQTVQQACLLGTAGYDQALFLQVDAAANLYVLGTTDRQLALTPAYFPAAGGNLFLCKLSSYLRQPYFVTQFGNLAGGTYASLLPTAFGVDDCGRMYIAGLAARVTQVLRLSSDARVVEDTFTNLGDHTHGVSRFDADGVLYQAICGSCDQRHPFQIPPSANYFSIKNGSANCNDAALKVRLTAAPDAVLPPRLLCQDMPPQLLGGTPAGGTWSGPGVSGASGVYYFTPAANLLGTHTLSYTPPSASTCPTATRTQQVTVRPPMSVQISSTTTTPICENSPYGLDLKGTPEGGFFSGRGIIGNSFYPQAAGPGQHLITYSFSTSSQCGSATTLLTVLPAPVVSAGPDTVLCGVPAGPFRLRGASPAGGTWSGRGVSAAGVFDPAVLRLTPGASATELTYTYVDPGGCTSKATRTVLLVPEPGLMTDVLPVAPCSFDPTQQGLAPFSVTFPQVATGPGSATWDFGDGTSFFSPQADSAVTHTYAQAGTYAPTLLIHYSTSCTTQIQYQPFRIGVPRPLPNIITPNGDRLNDTFVQQLSCQPPKLQVFSRWGKLVYETAAYQNDWDGAGLPSGIYYYYLRAPQGDSLKGWLQVLR